MDISLIETIPFFADIEAHTKSGANVPSGVYRLVPNPMQHTYIIDMGKDSGGKKKVAEIEFKHSQDKTELDNQFCRGSTNLCAVKHSADGNILFDLYFFAGIVDDFGELEILIERNKVGAFQNKERKPPFEGVCKQLPKKCAVSVNGEDYFVIQADFEKPAKTDVADDSETEKSDDANSDENAESSVSVTSSGAFALLCEQRGKCHAIKIQQKPLTSKGEGTYFIVTGVAPRKNMRPAGNYHLIKANLSFSDQKKAASDFNRAKLAEITESKGSYLKAWREYYGARGDRVLAQARAFGALQYESVAPETGSAKLYFKQADGAKSVAELVSDSSVEEIIINKNGTALPLFLQDKQCDFLAYCEKKPKKSEDEFVCEIVDCKENWIEVRPIGEKYSVTDIPPKGFVVMSMSGEESQIERQMKAWSAIAQGAVGITYLGNLLEGNFDFMGNAQAQRELKITSRIREKIFTNPPTDRQLEAIKIALATPDIALIQGPPGTGKTTVLTAILEILNEAQDKRGVAAGRVLICAYQHDAVDNMILDDKGKPRITVNAIPTWKYGTRRHGGGSYNDHIAHWCKDIEERVLSLNPNIQISHEEESFHAYTAEYVCAPTAENRSRLLAYISGSLPLTEELVERARNLNHLSERENRFEKESPDLLRKIRALRTTEKAFSDDGTKRAEGLYFALESAGYFENHKDAEHLLMEVSMQTPSVEDFSKLAELKLSLLEEFSKKPSYIKPSADEVLVELCRDVANHLEEQRGKKDKKEQIIADWMRSLQAGTAAFARAIKDCDFAYASTTQQAEGKDLRKQKRLVSNGDVAAALLYDTVIIDEAARATPPDLLIPMCKAAKRIILVGDHRQLPQLVDDDICNAVYEKNLAEAKRAEQNAEQNAKESNADKEFDYESAYKLSLFELLFKKLKELEEKDGIKRTATLDKQFRTHPVLGKFCSRMFYDDHGEHYDSPRGAGDFCHNLPGIENKAAVWIDVPASVGREAKNATSWTRECEADCIVEKLLAFAESQRDIPDDKKLSYGIISFYKGQKELIERKLNERKGVLKGVKYKVGTVDAFQGMEFDIVFLSVVRTNKIAQYGFLTSFNRMCVSMSRQKKALIAVGDSAFVTTEKARKKDAIPALAGFYNLCAGEIDNEGYGAVLEWKK